MSTAAPSSREGRSSESAIPGSFRQDSNNPGMPDVILVPTSDHTVAGNDDLRRLASGIQSAHDKAILVGKAGEKDGEGPVFGEVTAVTRGKDGRVYVLDAMYGKVWILGSDGRLLGSYGRLGRGPDEFFYPNAVAIADDSTLVVAQKNRVIKIIRLRQNGDLTEAVSFAVDYNPEALCSIRDMLVVRGYSPGTNSYGDILHVYNLNGDLVRSFGAPVAAEHQLMRSRLSVGSLLACDQDNLEVLTSFEYIPLIRGYDIGGDLRWEARLTDFDQINVRLAKSPSGSQELRFGRPEVGMDFVKALTFASRRVVLVQTQEIVAEGKPSTHSYLIDPLGRASVYLGPSLWLAKSGIETGDFVFVESDSFPVLRIARSNH